jgi:hypothetical protein
MPTMLGDRAADSGGVQSSSRVLHPSHLGDVGVYKVGITHCADDGRLKGHRRVGGVVLDTVQVRDLALERRVLEHYLPAAAVLLSPDLLPYGGAEPVMLTAGPKTLTSGGVAPHLLEPDYARRKMSR